MHNSAAFLAAADDGEIGFQNLFQLLGVAGGFIRFRERLVNPVQRLAHGDGGFFRQPVINPALGLARQNQMRAVQNGKMFGDGGRRKTKQLGDLADAQFAAPEGKQDARPAGDRRDR